MGYLKWVKNKWDIYYKNQEQNTSDNTPTEINKGCENFANGCAGCSCLAIILFVVFQVVSWAWHIHWVFGVVLLLIVLNIL